MVSTSEWYTELMPKDNETVYQYTQALVQSLAQMDYMALMAHNAFPRVMKEISHMLYQ